MSTRRKPRAYRDGGRVLADVPIAGDEPMAAPPPPEPQLQPAPSSDDALVRAAQATMRAEEIQRQHYQQRAQSPLEQHIASLPVSDRKKEFLRQNPAVFDQAVAPIFNKVYVEALQSGKFADDSPEIEAHLIESVTREFQQRELTSASARPIPENFEIAQLANDLQREAETYANEVPAEPAPAPQIRRGSIPHSAPVSREGPMMSGQRPSTTSITLSPEERQIAHSSRRDLPQHEAELLYARNKRLMIERKANGEIQGDR